MLGLRFSVRVKVRVKGWGEGKLKFSGQNSYLGMTIFQSGVVLGGAVNTFSPNSGVIIANTSGVVFDLNNFDNRIASLAGGGNLGGNINLGSGTLTLGDKCNTATCRWPGCCCLSESCTESLTA